jgi:hypothetical protein
MFTLHRSGRVAVAALASLGVASAAIALVVPIPTDPGRATLEI